MKFKKAQHNNHCLLNQRMKEKKLRYFTVNSGYIGRGYFSGFDFLVHQWNKSFRRVREGDYFLYRECRDPKDRFGGYFFGIGRVGKLNDEDKIMTKCKIEEPILFRNKILENEIKDIKWKKRQNPIYGISFETFKYFLELGVGKTNKKTFENENYESIRSHILLKYVDQLQQELFWYNKSYGK